MSRCIVSICAIPGYLYGIVFIVAIPCYKYGPNQPLEE